MPADPIALRRFTVREYYAMAEAGILGPDERVELLDGQVVAMSPIGARHADRVSKLAEYFVVRALGLASVRIQCPIRLDDLSEPEPDLALVRIEHDYGDAHPDAAKVHLVLEIAESSLKKDLRTKVPIYANAGIPEVWVIALEDDRVHVFRDPAHGTYRYETVLDRRSTIQPERLPLLGPIDVDVLLGR